MAVKASRINFFIDSAEQDAVVPWLRTGMFQGVTTNPQLMQAAGRKLADIEDIYTWARAGGAKEVCFQVWGADADAQYRSAMQIREAAPGSTIKVPCTIMGAEVTSRLVDQQIPVLMTAVYSGKQVLIASALGVKYIAPYFNRMFRAGRNGLDEIRHMTKAIRQDGSGPLIMAASLKSADHLVALADIGVRVFTVSPDVLSDLFADELTAQAVSDFEDFMADVF